MASSGIKNKCFSFLKLFSWIYHHPNDSTHTVIQTQYPLLQITNTLSHKLLITYWH